MSLRQVCWPQPGEACAKGRCRRCRASSTLKSRSQIARATGVNRWAVAPQPWRAKQPAQVVALEPERGVPIGQWRKPRRES